MSDTTIKNVWQLSKVSLPYELSHCSCLIIQQNTSNPKLIILGGYRKHIQTNAWFEFELCDIMGQQKFNRFMIGFQQVISLLLFF